MIPQYMLVYLISPESAKSAGANPVIRYFRLRALVYPECTEWLLEGTVGEHIWFPLGFPTYA